MSVGQNIRRLVAAHPDMQFILTTDNQVPKASTHWSAYTIGVTTQLTPTILATLQLAGLAPAPPWDDPVLQVYKLIAQKTYTVTVRTAIKYLWYFRYFAPPAPLMAPVSSVNEDEKMVAALLTSKATAMAQLVDKLQELLQGADYMSVSRYLQSVNLQRQREEKQQRCAEH